ncbi:MAG: InlB B-repeat-containing protein, partial [Clostridia bacterium]|nr:InlB B-repeat-containing protein [Clostridia bacterium]
TVKNSIFCESDWDVYGYIASGSITFENCYTLCAAATAGTVATAEQLSSGELGYKTGIAMKDGKLILADADHAAPVKYTYVVNEETVAVLYTDYAGVTIGTVADPEMDGYTFDGWTESADGEAGDKLFTTTFSSNLNADVNGDNETNSADVIALLQYFNGDTAIDTEVADVNGDGKVSLADALRLMKLLTA